MKQILLSFITAVGYLLSVFDWLSVFDYFCGFFGVLIHCVSIIIRLWFWVQIKYQLNRLDQISQPSTQISFTPIVILSDW